MAAAGDAGLEAVDSHRVRPRIKSRVKTRVRTMTNFLRNIVVGLVVGCIATAALGGDAVGIRLKDGSRWRGQVSDQVQVTVREQGIEIQLRGRLVVAAEWFITLETDLAGELRRKTIFKGDILSIRTIDAPEAFAKIDDKTTRPKDSSRRAVETGDANQLGVFVLPLKDMVGTYIRHEEMEAIAEEADKYGPGQTIVFIIDSGGGSVTEMEKIHEVLMKIKKRHRLVAWIKEAISAACAIALHCDEIYFMKEGTAGAMTAYSGKTALKGEQLEEWLRRAGDWAEAGGRKRYIAEAMIKVSKLLSYDVDPDTGERTFYPDLSGEFDLSDEENNLVFTATQAVHSGFADGIADTEEELAKVLDLPRWHENSDYGRKIAKKWYDTVKLAEHDLPLLQARLNYAGTGSGDQMVILGKRIKILQDLIRWHDRAPNVMQMQGARSKQVLQREIKELRKQLADLKKSRGGRRY